MGNKTGHARKVEPPSDDQAVLDILDSGTFPMPEIDVTDTLDHLTSTNRSLMEEIIDSSTVLRQYQPVELPAGWVQRVFGWFKRD